MQHATLKHSLANDLAGIQAIAARLVRAPAELLDNLREIARLVSSVDFTRYDPTEVRHDAHGLMLGLFDLRMTLHDEIDTWHRHKLMTRDVQTALREVFRVTRYATDMLGEIAILHRRLGEGEATYRGFTGPDFNTLGHPSLPSGAHVPFRSGDVLLMRGMAANSAAIARIGDIDSQFSHVGIVHIDHRGRHLITEALIEEGAIVNPLEHTLDHGLGRCIVFRHRDPELAARAGKKIHDYIAGTLSSGIGRPLAYDFSMELKGYKQLFCSKLIRQAFDLASDGKLLLPTYKTSLIMKNRDFFKRIGVTATETFAPGDMELEPGFQIVAEWADYRVTSDLRLADLAMDKFFEWMDRHHYRFKETFAIHLISALGNLAKYLSNDAKNLIADVVPKVPANMKRRTIATIAMLHKTTEEVVGELKELERRSKELTGRPLHPREVFEALERIREARGYEIGYLVKG
mgnify:CR=1 FL=1